MRWFASWDHRATAEALEWSVRRALMGEPRLRDVEAPRIRISASGAEAITLAGAVSTREAREKRNRAQKVGGLVTLHNELRTDTDLTRQLRSRLDADPRTRGLGKDSVVFQGTAESRGTATHDAQLVARKMAEAIDGVYGVANYVQLSRRVQAADEKRAA